MENVTRRRVLVLGACAAAAKCLGCSSSSKTISAIDTDVAAGSAADLPVGTLQAVGDEPVCIARDALGVYAMTLICTHESCDIGLDGSITPGGLECYCHGSRYDVNGNVTHPPATQPLEHYAVVADASGNLTIQPVVVAASTRLAV